MEFVTFFYEGYERVGILNHDKKEVIDVEQIITNKPPTNMLELIETMDDEKLKQFSKAEIELKGISINLIKLEAPIPVPKRGVICLGKNYRDHIKEVASATGNEDFVPEYPIYFNKMVDRAVAHDGIIPYQGELCKEMDYEVELAVVIGKDCKNVAMEDVEEYIFGYTILNDISIRNIQMKHNQWFRGKSLDGTCPIGPVIVHKSDIKFPVELNIKSYVNGELRQDSNTREFIYDIPYVISELSQGITLKPGDIISTGTPAGVGMGFIPPKYLKPGDMVECYVEGIGVLRNKVK